MILYVLYGMDRTAKILGGCWLAAGVLYYLILAARGGTGAVSFLAGSTRKRSVMR